MNPEDLKIHVLNVVVDEVLKRIDDYEASSALFVARAILKQNGKKLRDISTDCDYEGDIPIVEIKPLIKKLLLIKYKDDWEG